MKFTLITLTIALFFAFPAMAQVEEAPAAPTSEQIESGPMIKFEKETHDFGTLQQGGNATYAFQFTNTGTEDLKITFAKGSCGCTVPSWPQEAIAPGATGEIKVKYDSNRLGGINKTVTIQSNAVNSPTQVIRITGNIQPKPAPVQEAVPTPEGK